MVFFLAGLQIAYIHHPINKPFLAYERLVDCALSDCECSLPVSRGNHSKYIVYAPAVMAGESHHLKMLQTISSDKQTLHKGGGHTYTVNMYSNYMFIYKQVIQTSGTPNGHSLDTPLMNCLYTNDMQWVCLMILWGSTILNK